MTGIEGLVDEIGADTENEADIEVPIFLNLGGFLDSALDPDGAGYFTYFGSFTTPSKLSIYSFQNEYLRTKYRFIPTSFKHIMYYCVYYVFRL